MTLINPIRKTIAAAGLALAIAGGSLFAGDSGKIVIDDKAPVAEPAAWSICDIFEYNTLYEGDGFIKKVELHGRYHGQYIYQDEDFGSDSNEYQRWQHRRFRIGVEIEMAYGLTFSAENNMADNERIWADRFQNDWQDFFVQWEPNDDYSLTVGKQKQDFTIEDAESSKRILTVERSPIVNETAGARPWGVLSGFSLFGIDHQVGAWITGAKDWWGSWPDFDSNFSGSYNLKYEVIENTDLRIDYVFNDNSGGTAPVEGGAEESYASAYQHALALGTDSEWGRMGLITSAIFGWNREGAGDLPDKHDTFGFVVMPYYDITDKLQAVFRWAYMTEGREQRTQRFNERYTVSDYHTFYGGLNYYICGDKLKVMAGYEYATGDDFLSGTDIDTGTWQIAVRTYF